ncbi:hypothetical protein MNB_ARC-1_530 [hydrothermal vent metagenome]|uniref:Winged helix DNA-binding domain-containing protein n=1 Tax=hydrothermal vent metagenome TaxID=652676 RepID=A0A3B1EA30_9ZZZZ
MAIIFANEDTSFKMLKDSLKVTFGNLFIHLEKLEKAGYIKSSKQVKNSRSYTTYNLTERGILEFYNYMSEVEKIINTVKEIKNLK